MLEFMGDVKEIAGEKIIKMDKLREENPEFFEESGQMKWKKFEAEIRPNNFIYTRDDKNSLSFTIQKGPRKENGKNGIQIEQALEVILHLMKQANQKHPGRERALAITKLEESIFWSKQRFTNKCDYEHRQKED